MVLFTSGTEGAPKGVALSHANILANCAQVEARYDLRLSDIFFNPLPMFHAFGLTAGTLLGLMTSMRIYFYPTPLHYRQIPELIDKVGATVLVGTDTFLAGYARNADPEGFRSVRYVIAGGEALKAETRRVYREKFGLDLFEGYGVTEGSPVLAVNAPMFNRHGTVGKLLPHVTARLEPVPGIDEGGRFYVKGPNVMIGYYRADNPGEIEPPAGGWHDTGDIVTIDADGFVAIKGRAKRFAKLAGELVSLGAIEDHLWGLWPDDMAACVAAPDPKRGERVILATDHAGATKAEVETWMKIKGASAIMVPASVVVLDAIPLLGSGKTDYVALAKLLRERGCANGERERGGLAPFIDRAQGFQGVAVATNSASSSRPSSALNWDASPKLIDEPFVGLRSMREEEADRFFGRDAEVRELVEEVPQASHRRDRRRQRHGQVVARRSRLRPSLPRRRAR